jgi:hypothetical protein
MQDWIPETLDIKGIKAKPQLFDSEKVVPVLDLGQGGFAAERVAEQALSIGGALAGSINVTKSITEALDCQRATNRRDVMARVMGLTIEVSWNQAGATAFNGRVMHVKLGLDPDAGSTLWVARYNGFCNTVQSKQFFNPLELWDGIVPAGYRLEVEFNCTADWSGGGGAASWPAGTNYAISLYGVKKLRGGQLPI